MTFKGEILASLRAGIELIENGGAAAERTDCSHTGSGAAAPLGEGAHQPSRDGRRADDFESRSPSASGSDGEKTAEGAYRKILRWASVRERSTAYVRDRLAKDDYPAEAVEEALARACRARAIDDRRYADALVRSTLAAGKGLRGVEQEIEELGIEPSSLEAWTEHARGGREAEVNRALGLLRRRPPRAKAARDAAFRKLVGQGFSSDVASTAARLWSEEL